ncbi:MAG: hypothetical protein GXY76_14210 [Chloroflexi bacterium]|nr:hypothetical protein [Chloroflexota bacterium]
MYALTFGLYLEQPVLVSTPRPGDENSSTAYGYIPGSAIRGAVIERYLAQHVAPTNGLAADGLTRRLFFAGSVCYLNAYPAVDGAKRALPAPLSWRVAKDDKEASVADACDFAIEMDDELENPTAPNCRFAWLEGDSAAKVRPKRDSNVHNASDERGVKKSGSANVYRYEALAAGQEFGGAILAEEEGDLAAIQPLLEGATLRLGGSRNATYGRVRICKLAGPQPFREYPANCGAGARTTVTLLSNAILRGAHGQPSLTLDDLLGAKAVACFRAAEVVGGFNRTWGLPLPQSLALAAGSVFVYEGLNAEQRAKLDQWVASGIGERRAEGLGRIAVGWQASPKITLTDWKKPKDPPKAIALSDASHALAGQMANRLLRAELDKKLTEAVATLEITNQPPNTQLQRLRSAVLRAQKAGDLGRVVTHMNDLKGAKAKFEQAWIGGERLYKWVVEGIQGDALWNKHLAPKKDVALAGVSADVSKLKTEYVARLLDAVLRRAAKGSEDDQQKAQEVRL